jgi:hypothetical protein
MSSNINPNIIDGSYPVAGQDNNSQGFRDNFTNTKTNFQYAENEINDLQSKVILKAALTGTTLDNNMADALLVGAQLQDISEVKTALSTTSGSITINYSTAPYQTISTTGSITLAFSNFPPTGQYGYVKVQINITNIAHTMTLPAAVTLGTSGIQGYSAGTITFGSTGTFEFGFGTYDAGTTITVFDLNRALTNFTSFSVSSFTATGNITAGNVNTTGSVSSTGNIAGGNITTSGLVSATGNVTGGNVTGLIRPSAGTVTNAPIVYTSGTNLTTATAGAMEYDGKVFYGTAQSGQRGVMDTQHFIVLTTDYVGSNVSTAQQVFNSPAGGIITLPASTSYFLEAVYYITRAAGTTSHTLSTLFALGGTLTSIAYTADTTSTTGNALGAVSRIYATAATATVVTAASTAATENITVVIRGVVRTNTAGTFVPQIQYSAAPGGVPTILANSYLRLTPIGTNTVASVGNWS